MKKEVRQSLGGKSISCEASDCARDGRSLTEQRDDVDLLLRADAQREGVSSAAFNFTT